MHLRDTVLREFDDDCDADVTQLLRGNHSARFFVLRRSCGIDHRFVHDAALRGWLRAHGIIRRSQRNALDVYHRLLQFLFVDVVQPQPEIRRAVEAFRGSVGWSGFYVIGMHVRTGLLEGNVGWGRFLRRKDVDRFVEIAEKRTERVERGKKGKPVRWFVLSDNEEARRRVEEAGKGVVWTSNCTVAHTKTVSRSAWKCSVVENYLLSECDYLILTAKSTFGYLAKHRNEAEQSNIFPKS